MKVHQIYVPFRENRSLYDNETFIKSRMLWKDLCQRNGYEYHLWGEELYNILLTEYPQYEDFVENLDPIKKHDFFRVLCLHHFGGVYIDLDILPLKDDLEWIKFPTLRRCMINKQTKKGVYICNDFMAFKEGDPMIGEDYFNSVINSYYEKHDRYKQLGWNARFVLQTTGPHHLTRYMKKYKKDEDYNLFETNTWKNGKLLENVNNSPITCYHTISWMKNKKEDAICYFN